MATDFTLPYSKQVPDFRVPSRLQLSGRVSDGAQRFAVNLQSQGGEFLFHFNPRLNEDCVVRNCTVGGDWQAEERDGGMPFAPGTPFSIDISVEEGGKVVCSVNGSPFCEFSAREDLSQVGVVSVDGDIQLQSLSLVSAGGAGVVHEGADKVPREEPPIVTPVEPHPAPEPTPQEPQPPAQGPQGALPMPYDAPLQSLVQTNRMRVVGVPHAGAQRFTVNWKGQDGETLFHFNARFDQNCVVRNASVGHQYPPNGEERDGGACPFQPGRQFALDFLIHGAVIRCFVDGIEFCRFNARSDLSQVAKLDIHGDIALNQVLIA